MAFKKAKETKTQLRRKLADSQSCQVHNYHFASIALDKMGDRALGGGVIMSLRWYGEKQPLAGFPDVLIKDGFSKETIEAIRRDLMRSYEQAIELKPILVAAQSPVSSK